ncbi:hypothetical protein N9N67_01340 [Bacteriovoracaceae bacterium]|nr:hypothetical protein [Bacteriovoracaceae bacterium]
MKNQTKLFTIISFVSLLGIKAQVVNPLNTTSLGDYHCLQVEVGSTYHFTYLYGFWSYQYNYIESTTGKSFSSLSDCANQYRCIEGGFRYGEETYIDENGIAQTSMQYTHQVETPYCDIIKISHDKIDHCDELLKKVLLKKEK